MIKIYSNSQVVTIFSNNGVLLESCIKRVKRELAQEMADILFSGNVVTAVGKVELIDFNNALTPDSYDSIASTVIPYPQIKIVAELKVNDGVE